MRRRTPSNVKPFVSASTLLPSALARMPRDALDLAARARAWAPWLLAIVVVAVYASSTRGGFLNYDDDWLIAGNPVMHASFRKAMRFVWLDSSRDVRLALGAEYLPMRDTCVWIESRLVGFDAHLMRATSLALYVAVALAMRDALVRTAGAVVGEIAAWTFALHPAHADSVAWLAGRKDVLALLFVALALAVHARARRPWLAPLFVLFACLSKGVAVAAPLLLPIVDVVARRPIAWRPFAVALVLALAVLVVDVHVGAVVSMTTPPLGGARLTALATMGPVFAAYLAHAVAPLHASLLYDVDVRAPTDVTAWLAYAPLVAWAFVGVLRARRGDRLVLAAFAIFVVTMAPTSQVLFPLQNVRADRYLLLPVLGPCLLFAACAARLVERSRVAIVPLLAALTALAALSHARARVFSDNERLWRESTLATRTNVIAPYQLALTLVDRGDVVGAEAAYRDALARSNGTDARTISNLAILLDKQGRSAEAIAVLEAGAVRVPDDAKIAGNLAELVARTGDLDRAKALFDDVFRRFPSYEPARRNYARHFAP
jgi:hypothetical protein